MATFRLERELVALREKRIGFTQFARNAARDVDALAQYVLNRFDHPPSVNKDDLRQEVLIGIWLALESFDPVRGRSLRGHCTFTAVDRARKFMRSVRREDHHNAPGVARYELCEAGLARDGDEDGEAPAWRTLSVEPVAERMVVAAQDFAERVAELRPLERIAAEAIQTQGFDLEEAAVDFYLDRRVCGDVRSLAEARLFVEAVALRLAA